MSSEEAAGKRVSWVELYFDLIFVFAVGQLSHIMVTDPHWAGLGIALGLFLPLWWTWVGFAVLYNRHGQDKTTQRLLVLAGTLPCAVAAIETRAAADGHIMTYTFALAGARLILAVAFAFTAGTARRVAIGYGLSAAAFAASAFAPSPWRYVIWALALLQEAGFLLLRNEEGAEKRHGERTGQHPPARRSRLASVRAMLKPPADPARGVDAGHLAERFGLMIIILLGEVVVAVAAAAAGVPRHDTWYWLGLLAGLVLAAALWWIYFTAAAPISEYVLRASGGNPAMAYGLYAGGHLGPAFSLLTMAAGVSLVLSGEAPAAAAWFIAGGLASYLLGTRVVVVDRSLRFDSLRRAAVAVATACLAFLEPVISATGVVMVTGAWAVAIAAYVTRRFPGLLKDVTADPLSYFGSVPAERKRLPSEGG